MPKITNDKQKFGVGAFHTSPTATNGRVNNPLRKVHKMQKSKFLNATEMIHFIVTGPEWPETQSFCKEMSKKLGVRVLPLHYGMMMLVLADQFGNEVIRQDHFEEDVERVGMQYVEHPMIKPLVEYYTTLDLGFNIEENPLDPQTFVICGPAMAPNKNAFRKLRG